MNLYLIKYNNYYNRIIKKEGSLSDYLAAQYYSGLHIDAVSFNPNDGITTSQIVNFVPVGDYVIITEVTGEGEAQVENIMSRWFVTEAKRERTGQYMLMLRRDVIVDNYSAVVNSPIFVEKAILDNSDPMIFNKEQISLNQIKTSETPLVDETGIAWVVGYIPRDAFQTPETIQSDISTPQQADITVNGIQNWSYYRFSNLAAQGTPAAIINTSNIKYNIYGYDNRYSDNDEKKKICFSKTGGENTGWLGEGWRTDLHDKTPGYSWDVPANSSSNITNYYPEEWVTRREPTTHVIFRTSNNVSATILASYVNSIVNKFSAADFTNMESLASTEFNTATQAEIDAIVALDGKVIYDSATQLYYTISVSGGGSVEQIYDLSPTGGLFAVLKQKLLSMGASEGVISLPTGELSPETFRITASGAVYTITLSQYSTQNASIVIDNNRLHASDVPYDIFCLPYCDGEITFKNGNNTFTTSKLLSLNIAINIGAQSGTDNVYDVQILPYCPINFKTVGGVLDYSSYPYFDLIQDNNNNNIGILFWCPTASFTKKINCNIEINDPKIENQSELFRFCSPNYENAFDFNAAMNGGLDFVSAVCTYQPYSPLIHIRPNFKNLYGGEFKDSRGITCGGDYSVPQVTNRWADYKLANKSYLSIFESNVSSYTSKDNQSRELAEIKAIENLGVTETQQKLGNIKAMPSGLSRSSVISEINKIFPFMEHYTCTNEEKTAFYNKIKYEGMTTKRIGTISEFIQSEPHFIKGKFVRLLIDGEDYHVLAEISKELQKGVYI